MGCDIAEDDKFTKPKHRIIADAYAKRMDDVVSVSIENSHTDPAGINFDMNDLNSVESNAMGATLTNYMYNMINRRNAATSSEIRLPAQIVKCATYGSSCESEMSVTIQRYSVSVQESRRSSVDSQVSFKMSETEIHAKVESRSKKHKSVNMKAKKRNFISRRVNHSRRASSSSVESQRITKQEIKYRYPNRGILPNGNAMVRPGDVHQQFDISQLLNHDHSSATSDDDNQSNNGITTCQIEEIFDQEPQPLENMIGWDASNKPERQQQQQQKFDDNVDISHLADNHHIQALITDLLRNNDGETLKQILKSSLDRSESAQAHAGNNKPNHRSTTNQRYLHDQSQRHKAEPVPSRLSNQDDSTPVSSSIEDASPDGLNNFDENRSPATSQQNNDPQRDDDYNETHHLLPTRRRDAPTIVARKETIYMSESEKMEKLKKLLLPNNHS